VVVVQILFIQEYFILEIQQLNLVGVLECGQD